VKKNPAMHIPVFGNGDVFSPEAARFFKDTYHVDGLMIAREVTAIPGYSGISNITWHGREAAPPDIHER